MISHVPTRQTTIYRRRVDVGNGIACLRHWHIVLNRCVMTRDTVPDRSIRGIEMLVPASQRGNFRVPAATSVAKSP
jgi:hypothetical protein